MTPEAHPGETTLEVLQAFVGGCREWDAKAATRCGMPAYYVLWGGSAGPEGLGPRCRGHAAKHRTSYALVGRSAWLDLRELAHRLDSRP